MMSKKRRTHSKKRSKADSSWNSERTEKESHSSNTSPDYSNLSDDAQSKVRQMQTSKETQEKIVRQCNINGTDEIPYPKPDVTSYVYDESSGYFYDNSTGLYYDCHSQYYINADMQIYLYWDEKKQTYLLAPTDVNLHTEGNQGNKNDLKGKERQSKVKITKDIAQNLKRWAKSKEEIKAEILRETATNPRSSCTKIVEPPDKKLEDESNYLVAEYGGQSESDEDNSKSLIKKLKDEEAKLINWKKMACFLCKRKFTDVQILRKHQLMSDLHKQNLEILKGYTFSEREMLMFEAEERESKYRDQAMERKMKCGEPEHHKTLITKQQHENDKNKIKSSGEYSSPTKPDIKNIKRKNNQRENLGSKMLKAMGWNEGEGLGPTKQGKTGIIEVKKRSAGIGLGVKSNTAGVTAEDSYIDAARKVMLNRFKEIVS